RAAAVHRREPGQAMRGMRLRALVWLLLAVAILIGGVVEFSGRMPLQTNLLALLPPTERNPLAEQAVARLTDAAGNRVVFLIGHPAPETAAKAARLFAEQLRESKSFPQVVAEIPPLDPKLLTSLYLKFRFNLLSEADRSAFAVDGLHLGERLQQKLYAPFRFGLTLSPTDDPFGLTDSWLAGLPLRNYKLDAENGLLVTRDASRLWVMVTAVLPGSAYDGDMQRHIGSTIADAESALRQAYPQAELLRTGTVFYAADARASAEKEVDFIGAGSLIGMLLLLYLVFRSLRPLALGMLSVGFGISAAVVVTVWVYGELHLIALVFGASLIGEAIDYAIQYFAAHLGAGLEWEPMSGLRRIAPGLTVALATSLLGYGALMLAPFPALSQIALFALVGLGAAWLTVFLLLPVLLKTPCRRDPERAVALPLRFLAWWTIHASQRLCLLIAVLVIGVAIPGWLQLKGNDDVHLLVSRPPALLEQEERIRDLTGFGNSSQFFLVEGETAEAVLVNEERLSAILSRLEAEKAISGFQSISAFVPSLQQQEQNRSVWAARVFSDAAGLKRIVAQAGLRDGTAEQLIEEFNASAGRTLRVEEWMKSPFAAPFSHLWMGQTERGFASIVMPQGVRDERHLEAVSAGLPGVTFVDKAGSVSRLFREYRQWGGFWLFAAVCLVYGVLCLRYGARQAAFVLIPTLLAMALAMGVFGYLGTPITLFNLMGLTLVLGVGVNYAIFLREGGVHAGATLAGVLLSAGTTLLSFGLLAFSSMPALSGFGLTLLIGISFAVALAPMVLVFCPDKPA
ncbi:MAG: MMPL family transporter, partial [Betaproteobacteria bacterium]